MVHAVRYVHQVTEHVTLHSNSLCENMPRASLVTRKLSLGA